MHAHLQDGGDLNYKNRRSTMAEETSWGTAGREILESARNELYMAMPYLGSALGALAFAEGGDRTLTAATDGETLYYAGQFLAERWMRGRVVVNRLYIHMILHCMLRHIGKKKGKDSELWDLACDAAVESII